MDADDLYLKILFSVYCTDFQGVYRFSLQIIRIQIKMSSTDTVTTLERLANLLRIHSIESTQEANSGLIEFIFY
jgi:hypothetical protein